jgi:urease alpha subunit
MLKFPKDLKSLKNPEKSLEEYSAKKRECKTARMKFLDNNKKAISNQKMQIKKDIYVVKRTKKLGKRAMVHTCRQSPFVEFKSFSEAS